MSSWNRNLQVLVYSEAYDKDLMNRKVISYNLLNPVTFFFIEVLVPSQGRERFTMTCFNYFVHNDMF